MFEKEAKEYSTSSKVDYVNNIAITLVQQGFKDGAEFGYNKANEWHYVKDGDLPDEDVYVYLWCRGDDYPTVARRHLFKEWGRTKWCWDCQWGSGYTLEADNDRIIAWKEIVPPKE